MDSRLKKIDNPIKLLVVDDEKPFLDTLFGFLNKIKYEVVTASDGLEGLKLLKTEPQGFDLVITDLVMPKISGNYLKRQVFDSFFKYDPKKNGCQVNSLFSTLSFENGSRDYDFSEMEKSKCLVSCLKF